MANAKDDASTDIESLVKAFASEMTRECALLRKVRIEGLKLDPKAPQGKKREEPAVVAWAYELAKVNTSVRTPAEQARLVAKGVSWVCWSAHMSDNARHVVVIVNGKRSADGATVKTALGADFDAFTKKWGEAMKRHGLKNHRGGDGWAPGDEFHLELPNSKIARTDERAKACLDEYARLTRVDGKPKNTKFEGDSAIWRLLKPYVEKYENAKKK